MLLQRKYLVFIALSGEQYLIFLLRKVSKWAVLSRAKNHQNCLKPALILRNKLQWHRLVWPTLYVHVINDSCTVIITVSNVMNCWVVWLFHLFVLLIILLCLYLLNCVLLYSGCIQASDGRIIYAEFVFYRWCSGNTFWLRYIPICTSVGFSPTFVVVNGKCSGYSSCLRLWHITTTHWC